MGDGSSRRFQKQKLLGELNVGASDQDRGSSLFIRRVADLEGSENKRNSSAKRGSHFKDSSGKNLEIDAEPPFKPALGAAADAA